jgi:5-methylcytosine-specific restriction endonuclease McrA
MAKAYPYKKKRGKNVCRRCHGKVPPPKRYWCSDACVYDALIRCNPTEGLRWVRVRDKGVCASCGLDTAKLKKQLKVSVGEEKRELEERLRSQGFNPHKELWECDHILPVVEGGGHCTISNLRTLCIPCHKAETKALRARMKAKKDEVR